jgi:hypothetical protein
MFEPAHAGCYGFYVASGVSRIIMFFDWREGITQSGTGMVRERWMPFHPLVSEYLSRLTPAATVFSWERMVSQGRTGVNGDVGSWFGSSFSGCLSRLMPAATDFTWHPA